jgi:hypothetical protein
MSSREVNARAGLEAIGIQGFSVECEVYPREEREDCTVTGWLRHIAFDFTYVARGPQGPYCDKFYCERCEKWLSLAHSIGNLKKHIMRTHKVQWKTISQKLGLDSETTEDLTPEQKKKKVCEFVVRNCAAFRVAEDPTFRDFGAHLSAEQARERILEMGSN